MEIFTIIGIGLVSAVLAVVLRQYRPEYAMLVSLAAGVVILVLVCTSITPVVEQINSIIDLADIPGEYTSILFKVLGICFVTQIACDTCKDAGKVLFPAKSKWQEDWLCCLLVCLYFSRCFRWFIH